ncbi:hypothetical protein LXA39_17660 [Erwinia amylovora]|uniref:hypothetical protein n=1 Tax=Erwinia amylovora TaxID=552 RepID=UPI0020C053D7|nr:hypothetical protein [Erwinia amylovora]MCK8158082.1 hypothetical protein [Erwinia amylovora]
MFNPQLFHHPVLQGLDLFGRLSKECDINFISHQLLPILCPLVAKIVEALFGGDLLLLFRLLT